MKNIINRIKKYIYCRDHGNITLSTKEKAQILANGLFKSPHQYPVIYLCRGCNRYYVKQEWNKFGKIMKKEIELIRKRYWC